MLVLVDTNVVLRLAEPAHSQHAAAAGAIETLEVEDHQVFLVPQVIYEFWAVATRPPVANGLGLNVTETKAILDRLVSTFALLRDERTVFDFWQKLVADHDVKGKQVHDARLVAAMMRHGITHVLTFNAGDFARFPEITVIEPERAGEFGPAS